MSIPVGVCPPSAALTGWEIVGVCNQQKSSENSLLGVSVSTPQLSLETPLDFWRHQPWLQSGPLAKVSALGVSAQGSGVGVSEFEVLMMQARRFLPPSHLGRTLGGDWTDELFLEDSSLAGQLELVPRAQLAFRPPFGGRSRAHVTVRYSHFPNPQAAPALSTLLPPTTLPKPTLLPTELAATTNQSFSDGLRVSPTK